MPFAIKVELSDLPIDGLTFVAQKTMYGGKFIAQGDNVFVFASESKGGRGLVARGDVTSARAVAKRPGVARQTPRVTISIRVLARAKRPLGRNELKHHTDWIEGQPETELNFKLYRQATDKIVGLSERAAVFPGRFF